MNELNNLELEREEVIDGATVIHTGFFRYIHKEYIEKFSWEVGGKVDLSYSLMELVEMYDKDGNRFSANYSSIEKLKKKLKS